MCMDCIREKLVCCLLCFCNNFLFAFCISLLSVNSLLIFLVLCTFYLVCVYISQQTNTKYARCIHVVLSALLLLPPAIIVQPIVHVLRAVAVVLFWLGSGFHCCVFIFFFQFFFALCCVQRISWILPSTSSQQARSMKLFSLVFC